VGGLCEQMKSGKIKALFVHGANPTYTLPGIYGFQEALENVELVVSFASFPDEIALQADYIFPDRTPLESWGYQKIVTGSDRPAISGLQPVIAPLYDTRASADVLLEAARAVGGELAARVSFQDEVDFLQKSVAVLCDQGGVYASQDLPLFWALWREHGGWWKKAPALLPPVPIQGLEVYLGGHGASLSGGEEEYELQLLPFLYPCLADGSQPNWTVLQETPAPTSSTTLNTWIEINPQTARQVGVQSGEVVIVSSRVGEIEAVVVETADIQPGTVAIPLERGHTVSGNLSAGWDANPLNLLGREQNESGNLAFMATRVKVTPAGKRRGAALASQKGDQIA
jgi:anaerobic selenocysteine-containing dehydrogenase